MLEPVGISGDSWYILDVDSRSREWDSTAFNESDVVDFLTNLIAHCVGSAVVRHCEQRDVED